MGLFQESLVDPKPPESADWALGLWMSGGLRSPSTGTFGDLADSLCSGGAVRAGFQGPRLATVQGPQGSEEAAGNASRT